MTTSGGHHVAAEHLAALRSWGGARLNLRTWPLRTPTHADVTQRGLQRLEACLSPMPHCIRHLYWPADDHWQPLCAVYTCCVRAVMID